MIQGFVQSVKDFAGAVQKTVKDAYNEEARLTKLFKTGFDYKLIENADTKIKKVANVVAKYVAGAFNYTIGGFFALIGTAGQLGVNGVKNAASKISGAVKNFKKAEPEAKPEAESEKKKVKRKVSDAITQLFSKGGTPLLPGDAK